MPNTCLFCNLSYHVKPCLATKSKFCCALCRTNYYKGKHLAPHSEFKKGFKPWNTGKKMNAEYCARMSLFARTGVIGIKGKKMSDETRRKIAASQSGSKSSRWKGGITTEHELIRRSVEYKIWRDKVFKRDNFTCVLCGERGGILNSDHIKSFSLCPELRFDINNGQTLCKKHHDLKTKDDMRYITRTLYLQNAST